ncbi:MAG: T9SS type A sorting domain-containing protein [Bacteroidota bacterium]
MFRFLLALAVLVGFSPAIAAQSLVSDASCQTTSSNGNENATKNGQISWPADDPLWEFEFLRPENSVTADGRGLEIRNVYYDGRLVMKNGSVPVLNVEYAAGGCGCFRDWQDNEVDFEVAPGSELQNATCIAEPAPETVVTTCERNLEPACDPSDPNDPDCGDASDWGFSGVAVEDYGDELVLTTNMSAGWYRYRMKWHFYLDGRIWPEYSFSNNTATCTQTDRNHHAYWRFDFDLEGTPNNDIVSEWSARGEIATFTREADRTWRTPDDGTYWTVVDAETQQGYAIVPSEEDLKLPIDAFSKTDALILKYDPFELDDGSAFCQIEYDQMQNGEDLVDEDIVFWYRSSAFHEGGSAWKCDIVGPTLRPLDFSVSSQPIDPVGTFRLDTAGPNPFTPYTTVRFRVPEAQSVRLALYDALGREVQTLFEGDVAGNRDETVRVNGFGLPSGTYTVRLVGETEARSTRIVLVR